MTFGPAALIGLLGAALTAVSGWLTWLTGSQIPHQSGYDTPAKFLLDRHATAGGVALGVVMLLIGVLGAIGAILPHGRVPAIVLGVVSVVVAGLFVYQLRLAVHELNRTAHLALQVRDIIESARSQQHRRSCRDHRGPAPGSARADNCPSRHLYLTSGSRRLLGVSRNGISRSQAREHHKEMAS
ncbi:MAG: tetraspanin family protein [Actinomycetota bacterium]|nr:tetraspanin family protein [Actinomycetota bacterium]